VKCRRIHIEKPC